MEYWLRARCWPHILLLLVNVVSLDVDELLLISGEAHCARLGLPLYILQLFVNLESLVVPRVFSVCLRAEEPSSRALVHA